MPENANILMTGGTGNLGCQLLKLMLSAGERRRTDLFLLVRAKNRDHAQRRVRDLLKWLFKDKYKGLGNPNITILIGDISEKKLGLNGRDYDRVVREVDVIYHAAALTRFRAPLSKLRACNVDGTKRILDIVAQGKRAVELHYISTAFIAGTFAGEFTEDDFDVGQHFNNPYEQSKFEAEKAVRDFAKGGRRGAVYRPSIIVGEYRSGVIKDFQMFYQPLYLLAREVLDEIPVNRNTMLNIIPVDVAAKMILALATHHAEDNLSVYHIVSPKSFSLIRVINSAADYFDFKKPGLLPMTEPSLLLRGHLNERSLRPLWSYFQYKTVFRCERTLDILKKLNFSFPCLDKAFLRRVFAYAIERGYIARK